MDKIIVICGKSSVAKDTIARLLEQRDGYNFIVSTTTRPMRVGESDRNPYNFVTNDYFNKLIENNELIEHREYNTLVNNVPATWFYGIEKKEMEEGKPYVVVLDTVGLSEMKRQFGSRVISILIEVDDDIRLERAKLRGSFDLTEWNRRLLDDERIFSTQQFKNDIDFTVTNNTNNVEDCYDKIKEVILCSAK